MTDFQVSSSAEILRDALDLGFTPPPIEEILGNGSDPEFFDPGDVSTWPPEFFEAHESSRDDTVMAMVVYNDYQGTVILEPVAAYRWNGIVYAQRVGKNDFLLNPHFLDQAALNSLTPGTLVWVWVEDLNPDQLGFFKGNKFISYYEFAPKAIWNLQRVRLSWAMVEASLTRLEKAKETGEILQARVIDYKVWEHEYPAVICDNCAKTINLPRLKRDQEKQIFGFVITDEFDEEDDFYGEFVSDDWDLYHWQNWLTDFGFACPFCNCEDYYDLHIATYPKGGVIVAIGATTGYLPRGKMDFSRGLYNHLSVEEVEAILRSMVGEQIFVTVGKVDVEKRQLFVNEREAMQVIRRQRAQALWPTLRVGQIFEAVVTNIDGPLTFVRIKDCIDGIIPLAELQHGWVFNPADVVKPGDTFEAQIISVDSERQRVAFSRKALLPNPWENRTRIQNLIGQLKTGVMTNQTQTGAIWVEVAPGIAGPLYPSDEPGLHFEKGETVLVKVLGADFYRQRLQISHRQALQELFDIDLGLLVEEEPEVADDFLSLPVGDENGFLEIDLGITVAGPEEIDLDTLVGATEDKFENQPDLNILVQNN